MRNITVSVDGRVELRGAGFPSRRYQLIRSRSSRAWVSSSERVASTPSAAFGAMSHRAPVRIVRDPSSARVSLA